MRFVCISGLMALQVFLDACVHPGKEQCQVTHIQHYREAMVIPKCFRSFKHIEQLSQ